MNAPTGNLKLAQKLLGHASLAITADVYTHVSERGEKDVALAVEREIFEDLFPTTPNLGAKPRCDAGETT